MKKWIEMECILASASVRRAEILAKNNIRYCIVKPDVKEDLYDGLSPKQSVMYLALKKALAVFADYPNRTILAADTIVYKDEIIGKPKDQEDAERILKKLRNTCHEVLTGVAIIKGSSGRKVIFCDKTLVHFKDYSDEYIAKYIKTEHIYDKAGGYAIQETGGKYLVSHIEGDYDNVMGLPWYRVAKELTSKLG